jgi:uncharacterized integral membrane protein (TIGR00698 family)
MESASSLAGDGNFPPKLPWFRADDMLSIGLGVLLIVVAGLCAVAFRPDTYTQSVEELRDVKAQLKKLDADSVDFSADRKKLLASQAKLEAQLAPMPLKSWLARPGEWKGDPRVAFQKGDKSILLSLFATFVVLLVLFAVAVSIQGHSPVRFAMGFAGVFALALLSYVLAGQEVIKHYNLEYALWAVLLGLLISNTVGTPKWLSTATRTEFYIKTGLVMLGAEVLFNKLLALGLPGVFVAWVVTPIVLVSTYLFGQYILKIPSKSLNLVISADMSVCGVSAAVATAAACRAKKEELSLAIGLSLIFTVVMMVVMPFVVRVSGMGEVVGGAWIGGTVDSTGAVAAAGELVGSVAKDVAATVKMIQNILIGVIAFAVAVFWVSFIEPREDGKRPSVYEIWRRFPKFTLGFLGVSLLLSYCQSLGIEGKALVSSIVDGASKSTREWLFCLAFVSIGLESNFREYRHMLSEGKPVILYVCGQALNLLLTFLMAWLMFSKIFPNAASELLVK